MQVIVDSLLTHYTQSGDGKKQILLLHGWGDSSKTFSYLEKQLTKQYQTVSVDLPGFGGTQIPPKAWGLNDYGVFVKQFTQKIGMDPCFIIAHSNGASIAIKAIAGGLLQPEKLVLIGAAGIRNQQKVRQAGFKVIAKTGKALTFWLPRQHKKKLQKKLYGATGSDMLAVPALQETFKKTISEDVQQYAKKITIPTLLIYGENDRATPPMFGELYHKLITNSDLKMVKNAGHFVHHDEPDQVARMIQEFIA